MSSFTVLEELRREMVVVHQQTIWSKCLILPEVKLMVLAATESHWSNALLLAVHRRLVFLRQVDTDAVMLGLVTRAVAPDSWVVAPSSRGRQ